MKSKKKGDYKKKASIPDQDSSPTRQSINSAEFIKSFISLDGREKSVKTLRSFHDSIGKRLKNLSHREPMLSDIFSRLQSALQNAEKKSLTHINVTLDKSFKRKLNK